MLTTYCRVPLCDGVGGDGVSGGGGGRFCDTVYIAELSIFEQHGIVEVTVEGSAELKTIKVVGDLGTVIAIILISALHCHAHTSSARWEGCTAHFTNQHHHPQLP